MELNKYGNQIFRDVVIVGTDWYEQYQCTAKKGWKRYPTPQDHYQFGVWINEAKLEFLTLCEGDEIIVHCVTRQSFQHELSALGRWKKTLESEAIAS